MNSPATLQPNTVKRQELNLEQPLDISLDTQRKLREHPAASTWRNRQRGDLVYRLSPEIRCIGIDESARQLLAANDDRIQVTLGHRREIRGISMHRGSWDKVSYRGWESVVFHTQVDMDKALDFRSLAD